LTNSKENKETVWVELICISIVDCGNSDLQAGSCIWS